MATFSGGMKLKAKFNLSDDIMKRVDSIIGKEVRFVEELGKSTMKELREKIVNDWFGNCDGSSMNASTIYESRVKQSNGEVVITIASYVDVAMYDSMKSRRADKWHDTYGGDLEPGEYILGSQYDKGIIGLPEKATFRDTGWVNDYFIQRDIPLQLELENKLKKNWNKEINKRYKAMR